MVVGVYLVMDAEHMTVVEPKQKKNIFEIKFSTRHVSNFYIRISEYIFQMRMFQIEFCFHNVNGSMYNKVGIHFDEIFYARIPLENIFSVFLVRTRHSVAFPHQTHWISFVLLTGSIRTYVHAQKIERRIIITTTANEGNFKPKAHAHK